MTTLQPTVTPVKIALPTVQELRIMLTNPAVAVTAIICVTLLALAALAGVIYLAVTGHDTAVIGTLISGTLVAVATFLNSRMKNHVNTAVNDAVSKRQDA